MAAPLWADHVLMTPSRCSHRSRSDTPSIAASRSVSEADTEMPREEAASSRHSNAPGARLRGSSTCLPQRLPAFGASCCPALGAPFGAALLAVVAQERVAVRLRPPRLRPASAPRDSAPRRRSGTGGLLRQTTAPNVQRPPAPLRGTRRSSRLAALGIRVERSAEASNSAERAEAPGPEPRRADREGRRYAASAAVRGCSRRRCEDACMGATTPRFARTPGQGLPSGHWTSRRWLEWSPPPQGCWAAECPCAEATGGSRGA